MRQATFILCIAFCATLVKAFCSIHDDDVSLGASKSDFEIQFPYSKYPSGLGSIEESIYNPGGIVSSSNQYIQSTGPDRKILDLQLNVQKGPAYSNSASISKSLGLLPSISVEEPNWDVLASDRAVGEPYPGNINVQVQKEPAYSIIHENSYKPKQVTINHQVSLPAVAVKERKTIHLPQEKSVNVQLLSQQSPLYNNWGEKYQPSEIIVNEKVKQPSVAVEERETLHLASPKAYNVLEQDEPAYKIENRGYHDILSSVPKTIDVQIQDKKAPAYSIWGDGKYQSKSYNVQVSRPDEPAYKILQDSLQPGNFPVQKTIDVQIQDKKAPAYSILSGGNYQPGTVIVDGPSGESIALPNKRTYNIQVAEPQQPSYTLLNSDSYQPSVSNGQNIEPSISISERKRIQLPDGRVVNVQVSEQKEPAFSLLGSRGYQPSNLVVDEKVKLPSFAVKERATIHLPNEEKIVNVQVGGEKVPGYSIFGGSSYQPSKISIGGSSTINVPSSIVKEREELHLGSEHQRIKHILPRRSNGIINDASLCTCI